MHPSSLRDVTGATTSLNPQNSSSAAGTSQSRSSPPSILQGRPEQPSNSSTRSDNNNLWYDIERAQQAASSSSAMIGPTPTFYTADQHSVQSNDNQYQQWVDNFGQQPQRQQLDFSSVYQRNAHSNGVSQRNHQNPYGWADQFPSSSSMTQFAAPTVAGHHNIMPLDPMINPGSFPPQTGDMYNSTYYGFPMDEGSSGSTPGPGYHNASTPESNSHSYTNSPDPVLEQQRQQQQQQQPPPFGQQLHQARRREPQNPAGSIQSSHLLPPSTGYPPQPDQGQSTHLNPSSAKPSSPSNWVVESQSQNAPSASYQFQKQREHGGHSLARSPQSKPGKHAPPLKRPLSGPVPSAQVPPHSGSAAPAPPNLKRKRPRKADSPEQHESQHGDSDSDSDSDDGGIVVGLGAFMDSKPGKGQNRSRL
ncbi:hypothetical protein CVT26_001842 [Gymnopilus dilepis]|uniref:Uncharacterized protein n=1 Tax=Gymnopilus dilepis TaxID=231916 RepID=A0A409VRP7_9AGAR|nr:hypothetical protein CVT26_001842 [Gymnopilus dilepis]